MTDRDRHRIGDPLHDTVDEETGTVVGEIDPDPTPVHHVVDRITQIVGELDDNARNGLIELLGGHEKRGKYRAANKVLAATAVDPRKVIAEVDRDLPEWVRHLDERIKGAEAKAEDAAAKAKVCDDERLKREARAKWFVGGGLISGSSVLALLVWIGTSLEARATAAVEQRQRIEMLKEHETVLRDLTSWRRVVDFALGLRVPGVNP